MVAQSELHTKASRVRMVVTDCDGVLTDAGVYYSATGEELKRFSMRDGMGVERLMTLCAIPTAIITGEDSDIVRRRAEKLKIIEVHTGIKDKALCLQILAKRHGISFEEIAYIGDDYNDLEALRLCGFPACPSDALPAIRENAVFITQSAGGHGSFRELAEFIIASIHQKK